jgi:arylformamidase
MTMEVVDLTHIISESMPVFPGTEPPVIADAFTIERNGFAEKMLQLVSHTGTHIDAPGHILAGAPRLDEFAVSRFLGPGLVLDVSAVRGRAIETGDIEKYESLLHAVDFALLHSGWAEHWGHAEYFKAFPILSPAAALWLAGFALKGVGTDTISVDEVDSTALVVHRTLFAKNFLIIENLADLGPLIGKRFVFSCLPLKITDADGSPVRAVAILDSTK